MIWLKGAPVSLNIQNEIKTVLAENLQKGFKVPHLAVVLVGQDQASQVYVSLKEKMCAKLGFKSTVYKLPDNTSQESIQKLIIELNTNSDVDGILIQLPLPAHLSARTLLEYIDPRKDVDCLTESNLGKVLTGRATIYPCTPAGILEIFKFYDISLKGKNIAVVGRSLIVGTPLFHLLNKENATVTLFHSKSADMKSQLKNYDIVCVAIGKSHEFKYTDFKAGAIVIDVGITRHEDKLYGDVDLPYNDDQHEHLYAATPVPGGVGVMTIAMLMKNTLTLALNRQKK